MERLQKIIARAGITSRRGAERLIRAGRIAVDGTVVTRMGFKADPRRQIITCDGKVISAEKKIHILLHKPVGYVTTLRDPQGRPIVTDLLDSPVNSARLFPVGRLDIDTSGALIMTNDGDLAHRILHPSHTVDKSYLAVVRGHPGNTQLNRLERGIEINGRRTAPARVEIAGRRRETTTLKVIIHEGKKRQIRKMMAAINHPVLSLKRTAYGNLRLGNLRPGQYRYISREELKKIFS